MSVMDAQPRPPHHRNRSSFSFRSSKSDKSGHKIKMDLKETPREKARTHLTETTKANPNAAMNEAQPIAAALEKSTLTSIRLMEHKDEHGNVIAEPDLSNPTRSRWERPLDTIRSFEASIDGSYKRRSMVRAETAPEVNGGNGNPRHSHYNAYDSPNPNRFSQYSGYYANRGPPGRDFADNGNNYPAGPSAMRSRQTLRLQSDPMPNRYGNGNGNGNGNANAHGYVNGNGNANGIANGRAVYPTHGYHQSRDTMDTSGSPSEPWTNSTDPSSENSSIDRIKPENGEQNGFPFSGGNSQFNAPGFEVHGNFSQGPYPERSGQRFEGGQFPKASSYAQNAHAGRPSPPGAPIPLGGPVQTAHVFNAGGAPTATPAQPPAEDKRKSWFKRRFSKNP